MSEGVSSIGSCIAFSATLPADEAIATYEALTWTDSGEAITLGDIGPENAVITYDTVCDGIVNKRMGSTNYGQQAMEFAYVSSNAAQVILSAAVRNKSKIAARETLPTGDVIYYSGYVAKAKQMTGGAGDILKLSVSFEIDGATVEDLAA